MKVRDVMTDTPVFCHLSTDLGSAVEMLWNCNCGILPVVNDQNEVVSVITDRDICIALGTRNVLPGDITVGDVAKSHAICCQADVNLRAALDRMAEIGVRRLPVVDDNGRLVGLLSMDDVMEEVPGVETVRGNGETPAEVLNAMKMICAAQVPKPISHSRARAASYAH